MSFELDPQIASALRSAGAPATEPPPVGEIARRRAQGEALIAASDRAIPRAADVDRVHRTARSSDGATIDLFWYWKRNAPSRAAALYFHGGGYIQGRVGDFDHSIARYVSASGVSMLLVDYRLAPEHPFPAPEEDALAALEWAHDHADELGVDPARIAVMGDSAGAGLAASLAILARDRGGPAIARQILVMPMLDDRNRTPDPQLAALAAWTYDDNVTAWNALLGDREEAPATAAPARLGDATGLPPAYIEVGQIDIFRDEDLRYAIVLSRAGVEVELHLWPGAIHEFDGVAPESAVARRAISDRVRVLRSV